MSCHLLSDIYKKAGIKYRYARPQCRHLIANRELDDIRFQAAHQLLNLLASGQNVLFVDECTIQS